MGLSPVIKPQGTGLGHGIEFFLADESDCEVINNITASCMKTDAKGTDFMFPLANRKTLKMFQIEEEEVLALCRTCTRYVRYVLDQVQDNPERLGLPARSHSRNEDRGPAIRFRSGSQIRANRLSAWPPKNLLHSSHH